MITEIEHNFCVNALELRRDEFINTIYPNPPQTFYYFTKEFGFSKCELMGPGFFFNIKNHAKALFELIFDEAQLEEKDVMFRYKILDEPTAYPIYLISGRELHTRTFDTKEKAIKFYETI